MKKDYAEFQKDQEELRQIKSARVRCWGVAVSHIFLPPIFSVVYALKIGKWKPTLIATGVGLVGVPLTSIDMGLTLTVAAPVTSAAMIINQVKDDRRRQQFLLPEDADKALYERSNA